MIHRELKRNVFEDQELPNLDGYCALSAQTMCERRHAIHRKTVVHPEVKSAIENRLNAGWSPEQIAGQMCLERHPILVRQETIHRLAHSKYGRAGPTRLAAIGCRIEPDHPAGPADPFVAQPPSCLIPHGGILNGHAGSTPARYPPGSCQTAETGRGTLAARHRHD